MRNQILEIKLIEYRDKRNRAQDQQVVANKLGYETEVQKLQRDRDLCQGFIDVLPDIQRSLRPVFKEGDIVAETDNGVTGIFVYEKIDKFKAENTDCFRPATDEEKKKLKASGKDYLAIES